MSTDLAIICISQALTVLLNVHINYTEILVFHFVVVSNCAVVLVTLFDRNVVLSCRYF